MKNFFEYLREDAMNIINLKTKKIEVTKERAAEIL